MSHQNPLTVVVPVMESRLQDLKKVLYQLKQDLQNNTEHPFGKLGTIHFCRWIILEKAEINGRHYNTQLAFSSNFDGEIEKHIGDLSSGPLAGLLDNIYENCHDYPEANLRTTASRINYLKKWRIRSLAFYKGAPGRSIQQIKEEAKLRNYLRDHLNSRSWQNLSATAVHQELKKVISTQPDFQWLNKNVKLPKVNYPGIVLLILIGLLLLPILIIWILIVHFFYERRDLPPVLTPSEVDGKHIQELEENEDLYFQNQFTQLLVMKPGIVRFITLKVVMLLTSLLTRFLFIRNNLMGIPTIHFARWLLIDNRKRMLFLSNFDGSWQQYLGDFIDKSGWGLNAIWSNTMGFPRTRFFIKGGAYDAEHFLAWSRYYQIKTQFWYSAYPELSVKNIINNSQIRVNLMKNLDEENTKRFLKRL